MSYAVAVPTTPTSPLASPPPTYHNEKSNSVNYFELPFAASQKHHSSWSKDTTSPNTPMPASTEKLPIEGQEQAEVLPVLEEGSTRVARSSWKARIGSLFTAEEGRAASLDGLRLVAALMLLTSTVISRAITSWPGATSIFYPFASDFGLIVFMVISGRVIATPWLESVGPERSNGAPAKRDIRQLGQALLKRPFRFILPALVVSGLQLASCRSNFMYPDLAGFNLLVGGADTRPQWCAASNRAWFSDVTSLVTTWDVSVHLRSTVSMLYVTPWLMLGSLYTMGFALLSHLFRTNFRWALYIILAFLNWMTYSFLSPFILGLVIADLQVSGVLSKLTYTRHSWSKEERSCFKLTLPLVAQVCTLAMFIIFTFVPVVRERVSDALATIQVLDGKAKVAITTGFELVRFSDVIGATFLVLFVEICSPVRLLLSFKPVAFAGRRLAAGIVVCHPLALYGIVPRQYAPSADYVLTYSGSALRSLWGYTFGITLGLAIIFAIGVDFPSWVLAKLWIWFLLPNEKTEAISSDVKTEASDEGFKTNYNMIRSSSSRLSWVSWPSFKTLAQKN